MDYKKMILALCLIICVLFTVSSVCASEANETDTIQVADEIEEIDEIDNGEIMGETDDGTFASLNQKIQNAGNGSEITLENDYKYEGTGYPDGISITKRLTIDGKGHTIDAKGQARIFNISRADNVTIKNITFINAKAAGDGGAIYCSYSYNLSVYGCTFINNTADDNGGAIYCHRRNLTISECDFESNSAYGGAAIFCSYDMNISGCNFTGNNADYGGAIVSQSGIVSNCSFVSNSAGAGGAIVSHSGTFVSNCDFVKNSAGGDAGAAILCSGSIVSNCSFENNSAGGTGGALRFEDATGAIVSDCDFVNNAAYTGGAIYWFDYTIGNNVSDCDFVNNSARGDGGAIVYGSAEQNVLSGCTFKGNTASENSHDSRGGAIYWLDYAIGNNVSDCDFVNNSAGQGGAIYWTHFSQKNKVFDCDFVSNSAWECGGAIFWYDNFIHHENVSKCNFVNNSAGDSGGALYMYTQMSFSIITDCVFVGNHARLNGGAMEFGGLNCSVNGCIFMNNSARRGNSINSRGLDICNNIFLYYKDEVYGYDWGDIYCNWCGHNATNYLEDPNLPCGVWLFLNATSNPSPVSLMDPAEITFKLYAYDSNSGTISEYDNTLLKTLNLTITPTKGNVNVTTANFGQSIKYTPFGLGEDEITAKIENVFYKFQFNVIKTDPNLSVENQEATYGESIITVLNYKPDATGKVNITLKGKNGNKYTFTDMDLNANVPLGIINADEYYVTVTYSGDEYFANSTAAGKLKVNKRNSDLTAKAKTFKTSVKTKKYTITLKDNTGKVIKNAKVTLKVKGKTYKATTNSKGKATFKITKLTKKGTYKATITFKGDKFYKKVSKKAKIKVIVTFKTVSKGSKDKSTVKEIQQALKNKGYYLTYKGHYLKVDGKFSSCTFRSVKQFQKDKGLKVTGKVDEKTAKKLGII